MTRTVRVSLGERSYDIGIGSGIPTCTSLRAAGVNRALVVSDSNVEPLYGAKCLESLAALGVDASMAIVPAGEESKCQERAGELYATAIDAGLDRGSCIVALGGGVVGDLAGFVASTFLRGIRLLQLPTTLLAMVDSSVGGKTAVNLPQGKNLVGTFYQPMAVDIDLDTLGTLPQREYLAGLAEVVKYGVIWDRQFFDLLENRQADLVDRDSALLAEVVARCCEIKAEVVSEDEREGGLRAILNFGHTFGHAVEKCGGFGTLLHGEAVSIGMIYAGRLSVMQSGMPEDDFQRLKALLAALGLPVTLDAGKADWDAFRKAMAVDKKTRSSVPRFVLAGELGRVIIGCEVPEDALASCLSEVLCHT